VAGLKAQPQVGLGGPDGVFDAVAGLSSRLSWPLGLEGLLSVVLFAVGEGLDGKKECVGEPR